jgi:hypothetical protein
MAMLWRYHKDREPKPAAEPGVEVRATQVELEAKLLAEEAAKLAEELESK